jgi:hypothetical protein
MEDAEFSGICILGKDSDKSKNSEPCFEQASIQSYSIDSFKAEFTAMLNEYKKISLSQDNEQKMEVNKMEKVINELSALTFKCGDRDKKKYEILSITETEANVIDREDNYKVYSIPYEVADENITFNYNAKVEKSLDVKDMANEGFSIKNEIDLVSTELIQSAISSYESSAIDEMTSKYNSLKSNFDKLIKDYEISQEKLCEFQNKKLEAEKELHKNEINNLVESYASKMETYADFLIYRSKIDYSKTKEQVNTDLLILLGKANLGQKSTYSFKPVISGASNNSNFESDNGNGRYGDLFDKIK